jgi:hypothetical protein
MDVTRSLAGVANLVVFWLIFLPAQLTGATAQVAYTYATHRDPSNGHFVVEITSTSTVPLLCQIQYSGRSFLNAELNGQQRFLTIRAEGRDGTPVIAAAHFGGFRTFTATAACQAR